TPTAAVAPRAFFADAVRFAERHDIVICHDAAYAEIYFGERPPSILEVPGGREVAIEFHSLSKTFSMTGWRVGFAVGHPELIAGLGRVKTNVDSGVFQAVREAAIAALTGDPAVVDRLRALYRERRDVLVGGRHASSRLHRDRIEPGRPQGERPGSGRARREAAEHAAQPRLLVLRERAARRRQDVVREQRDRGRDRVSARRAPEALEGDREGDGAQARQGQALGLAGDRPRHPPLRPGGGRDQVLEGPPPRDAQTPLRPPAAGRAGA